MRKLFRILTPILAAAAIALSSGSAVLAAASSESDSLDTSWCFQDVTMRYCFDVTGHVHYLDNKAGESLTLQQTTITKVYEGDVYQGESKSVEQLRGVFADDGTVVMSSRVHTRLARRRGGLRLPHGPQDRRLRDHGRPHDVDLRRGGLAPAEILGTTRGGRPAMVARFFMFVAIRGL